MVKYLFLLYATSETLPERAYLARRVRELA